jgi:hypothetical protein
MFKLRSLSLLLLFLVFSTLSIAGLANAQDSVPPADPAALEFDGRLLSAPQDLGRIERLGDWTMLAYQKRVDQNWEIYVHTTAGPRRLTNNSASDEQPALDRGTNRVAFVSNRSGDFDLYVMGADGSGLRRILDNRTTIAFPAWSPDGTRIAVQALLGSQYEIYVVDADGRNPQRLTNSRGFDGMPTWSPDGRQLAFASSRSGDYRIYVMNADGSGLRRLSSYPLSLHPSWSPDGKSIAFDADVDGDGWQELAVIDAAGTGERIIYNPGGLKTAWAGSWAPDKSSLGFTEITAARRNGQWTWVDAVIRRWNPTDGATDLIPGGVEWYMNWASSDAIPPQTRIEPLPHYSRAADFVLRWSGTDAGDSGLKSYSVYYNAQDGRGWRTLRRDTEATEAPFPAVPGTTVEFLVTGTDNAFNSGSWREQSIERTTFYDTSIGGAVYDNRGNPLSGVRVASTPPLPTGELRTARDGHFAGYSFAPQAYALSVDEPGFQPVPKTDIPSGEAFERAIYLLPRDSRIKNGTFESGGARPTNWTSAGILPQAVTTEDSATGRYAMRLGPANSTSAATAVHNAGSTSIAQLVSIPAGMEGPTLSYMARSVGLSPSANSGLRVFIGPSTQKVPLSANAARSGGWQLNWIDMSPWRGQQVTVTFELVQDAADPAQTVYLDDISLGAIHPDLWVTLATGPREALPGEIVVVSLDYGNRGSLEAGDAVVELALPSGLSLISATAPYTLNNNVLHWEVGDLPPNSGANRLQVELSPAAPQEQLLELEALIFAAADEVHMRNNTSTGSVRVAKSVYLPLVTRQ